MGKSSWMWQLERRRKYYLSFCSSLLGNSVRMRSRTTSTVATTAVTFSVCLLLYVNLWSSTSSSSKPGALTASDNIDDSASSPVIIHDPNHREIILKNRKVQSVDFKGEVMQVKAYSNHEDYPRGSTTSQNNLKRMLSANMDSNSNNIEKLDRSLFVEDNKGGEDESKLRKVSDAEKMKHIFKRADVNRDGYLSFPEITKWINDGIKQHFGTAFKENFDSFFGIDKNPRNGRVEWSEYLNFHMKKIGYKGTPVTPEAVRNKEKFKLLPKHIKVEIAALEARWSETASNDPDFLTVDEFLAFTHPEASPSKLLLNVQDTFNTFDLDGDGIISKAEFDTTYAEAEGVDNVYREDLHLIDTDGNQQISRVELMRYMDPKNIIHSERDARKVIEQVDVDGDGKLRLDEVITKFKFVLPTKLFDIANNFHLNQLHS